MQNVIINNRFCGPPDSGNGGYVCGLIASHTHFDTEVMLRKPPPLNKNLKLLTKADSAALMDEELLIAEAKPAEIALEVPNPISFKEAQEAAKNYIGHHLKHPFPTCFVCGPKRDPGDGLQIFAGRVGSSHLFATPWIPDQSLSDEKGIIKEEFLWAAMDCPGAFSIMGDHPMKLVLGKMKAKINQAIKVGEKCVLLSWKTGNEGRKYFCGTAIYNEKEELCAYSEAIWIDIGNK